MIPTRSPLLLLLIGLLPGLGGCDPRADAPPGEPHTEARIPDTIRTIVDSILPIEEEIRRFNATIPEMPDALAGGAPSRDELVLRFVGAVEAADTAAFRDLVMTRSEFAALYYPHTRYLHPPFQLSPALVWFMQENRTSQGFARIARRLAGKRLHAEGYTCTEPPEIEERNRIWHDCRILLRPPGSDSATAVRLFGSILERDGIHKFVSYSNDF